MKLGYMPVIKLERLPEARSSRKIKGRKAA
jgi:hypothetical protein